LGALEGVPDVLKDPAPSAWLTDYGDSSVAYTVKFFVSDFESIDRIQSQFLDLVWYHFKRENVEIPFPIRDVRLSRAPARAPAPPAADQNAAVLDEIDLFSPLSADERAGLAASLREEIYARGEVLVRQGDPGDTFYIVKSGRVKVSALRGDADVELAKLGEGDYFGEMNVLTGECRNATVTAETDTHVLALSHHVLAGLLKKNASLSEEFAAKLERRSERYRQMTETVVAGTLMLEAPPTRADLLDRIRGFFRLGKK